MKTVSMSGSLRENVGKKDAKKHRMEGKVPCVIYGGKEQIHFVMDERSLANILFTPEIYIIKLDIDGKQYETILQDVQYHPVTDKILHSDFLEIILSKPLKIALPVLLQGSATGVIKGGRLVHNMRKIMVKGLAEDIPENILIDITDLEIGDSVKIKDLSINKLHFLDLPSEVVASVRTTRVAAIEEEEKEEGAEEAPVEGGEAPAKDEGKEKPAEDGKKDKSTK